MDEEAEETMDDTAALESFRLVSKGELSSRMASRSRSLLRFTAADDAPILEEDDDDRFTASMSHSLTCPQCSPLPRPIYNDFCSSSIQILTSHTYPYDEKLAVTRMLRGLK